MPWWQAGPGRMRKRCSRPGSRGINPLTPGRPTSTGTLSDMSKFPLYLNGGGFPMAWEVLNPNLWASLRIVIPATILSSLLGVVNGYLLSKWKFWGSDPIFTLILFGMFIPYQAILIPLIQFLNRPGMYGSW